MNMHEPIAPLDKKLEIPFEHSFSGCNIPINIEREFRRGNALFKEQEKIYVVIPAGIDDGEIIEIPEKGNIMFDKRGVLRLHIKIGQHSTYERKGINLVYNQTITFKESLCGFEYLIHFIDGSPLKLKSSKGNIIQNGDDKNVKGKGFNRDGQVGDLIIKFKVTPQELTEEQIAMFEKEL
jgi:DnaJ family protein A protein 2